MTRRVVVAGALLALLTVTVATQDWPGWRGAEARGRLTGFAPPAPWPEKLERGWRVEVGTGHSTPALVGGRLHVHARQGDDEVVLCLEAATGKEVWRDTLQVPYEMDPTARKHGKGPKSSVSVADGRVFALGITSVLSCLDAKTGKIIWRNDFRDRFEKPFPRYGSAMSPLVVDGMCIAHVGGPGKGAMVALDAATGKQKWSWDGDGPGYASPVVRRVGRQRQLITLTQSHAVGLSPADGKLLWKIEFTTIEDQNSVTPIVFGDTVILSGYHLGTTAHEIAGDKPAEAWSINKASMYMSSPVLLGDRFFGFSEKRRGQFVCVDAASGDILWRGDGRQGENAALVAADGVLLALTTKSELVVFSAAAEDYEELARYEVADSPTWAHPVISGKSVFIKDKTHLTQWKLP